ncbi:universal stress protein [Seonamhaeicola maritimus]|uniref:Universal stress protein n=1 Tax=Seonamhaeicola maritimus TaxID=2591822 RepID=A0A5C7GFH0_9FLAO|nr:universal stress protein [Seonamhaeicola maritimus]TXG35733.1 universal stress protein [Seonamhaeicola maritimus]
MKTILLPTDFSKNSLNAINYATELFKNEVCEFYILNVQKASSFISDDMMVVSSSATIYSTLIDAAKKSITNIISSIKLREDNDKHQFHSIVDYDNFIDSINQTSEKHQVDLIIMGTKGASGLQRVLFGSNTARVMQRCHTPVLAIPEGCKYAPLNKIAFTTNHINLFTIDELQILKTVLHLCGSKLYVLHVADEHHLAQKQLQNMNFFDAYFPDAEHDFIDVNKKDMFDTVHQYILDNDIDILSMISEKHSFLERLFTRHALETFAFSIDVPFLVVESSNKSEAII